MSLNVINTMLFTAEQNNLNCASKDINAGAPSKAQLGKLGRKRRRIRRVKPSVPKDLAVSLSEIMAAMACMAAREVRRMHENSSARHTPRECEKRELRDARAENAPNEIRLFLCDVDVEFSAMEKRCNTTRPRLDTMRFITARRFS